jgi:hypothetical protein
MEATIITSIPRLPVAQIEPILNRAKRMLDQMKGQLVRKRENEDQPGSKRRRESSDVGKQDSYKHKTVRNWEQQHDDQRIRTGNYGQPITIGYVSQKMIILF